MTWWSEHSAVLGFVLAKLAIRCRFVDRFVGSSVPSNVCSDQSAACVTDDKGTTMMRVRQIDDVGTRDSGPADGKGTTTIYYTDADGTKPKTQISSDSTEKCPYQHHREICDFEEKKSRLAQERHC
jgi:hypothetical protein